MTDSEHTIIDTQPGITGVSRTLTLTPKQTLARLEAARMRVFVWLVLALCGAVTIALPMIDRPAAAKLVAWAGVAMTTPAALWFAWALRRPEGYTPSRALGFALICEATALAGTYFFGTLSPACAGLALGLYVIAPGQDQRAASWVYATTALLHAFLTIAVLLGWLPDVQMVPHSQLPVGLVLLVLALAQAVLFVSFSIGRTTRRTMLSALEQHDRAQRAIALRGELLKEAHQELERALQTGGLGRFTDETLGDYKLGSVLGRGGMGEVYAAVDTRNEQRRAIKILYPHVATDRSQVERFLREARITTALDAPNVCRVLEVGDTPSGVPFLVMERLEGEDLAEILRREDLLPISRVAELVSEISRGLEAARLAGVVHRDIKPRNLFAATLPDGDVVWKILDFGVSKAKETSGTLTKGQIVGTPRYMAPEQATGRPVDHRADQFALATVAYRALTGRPAFKGESTPEILYQVLRATPPAPSSLVSVHPDVDVVLSIAMAKEPDNRFENAAELAEAFEKAARGELDRRTRERGRHSRPAA